MNAIVAHYSRFGNTEKVAREIAGEFRSAGHQARVVGIEELPPTMEGIDMLAMGSPTHRMRLPGDVRDTLDELPDGILRDIPVAVYDTSYRMNWLLSRFTASRRLEKALRKLGGKRVINPETFHVDGREGPLHDGEVERARLWAVEILGRSGHREAMGAAESDLRNPRREAPAAGGCETWRGAVMNLLRTILWSFGMMVLIGGSVSSAVFAPLTLVEDSSASKDCMLGYRAQCSFAPASTLILVAMAIPLGWGSIVLWRRRPFDLRLTQRIAETKATRRTGSKG